MGEGRISTRGTSVRNSGEGWYQRHDNILDIGQPINVIPHLLRDLKDKIRSRNKSGMTELSCHCEVERSEAVAIAKSLDNNEITTSCAAHTPRNDKKFHKPHYTHFTHAKRVAFTLAEVLITLGIIGVVAAMTIPTISHNIQQAVLKNQFKKFYSTFWQAVIGTQTKEGRPLRCYYWDGTNPYTGKCTATCDEDDKNQYGNCKTGTYYCKETGENLPADFNGMYSDCSVFHEELFLNTLKTTKICKDHAYEQGCLPEDFRGANIVQSEQNPDKEYDPNGIFSDSSVKNNYPVFVLADGTYIIEYYAYLGGIPLYVFDINGHRGPNKWGYDIFGVELQGNNKNGISKLQGAYFALEEGGKTFQQMYDEAFN